MPDTQSGYRLYPLAPLRGMRFFTPKYEFEIEVLVRAAWAGVRVGAVPIAVYYAPDKERITHFRPFQDFSRISMFNTVLVIIALLYVKPRQFFRSLFRRETYARLLAQVFNAEETAQHQAWSMAFGVFMGLAPIWGFQLLVAIPLALFPGLNRYLVVLAANISLPPMIPLIICLSYRAGGLVVGPAAAAGVGAGPHAGLHSPEFRAVLGGELAAGRWGRAGHRPGRLRGATTLPPKKTTRHGSWVISST